MVMISSWEGKREPSTELWQLLLAYLWLMSSASSLPQKSEISIGPYSIRTISVPYLLLLITSDNEMFLMTTF